MFEALASIAEALVSAVELLLSQRKRAKTDSLRVSLLTASYYMAGLVKTGDELLQLAGDRPLVKLQRMTVDELRVFHLYAQRLLSMQLERLQNLDKLLKEQEVLDLLAPDHRERISRAIGWKGKGLIGVGAYLLFYLVFNSNPRGESTEPEELQKSAEVLCAMYPKVEEGVIALDQARTALDHLRTLAAEYRQLVLQLIPQEALPELAARAARLARTEADGV